MTGGPRIAVLGAGSVGCFIGGAWAAAGLPVTFIGRPNISKDVDRHGLTLTDYSEWRVQLAPGEVDYRCGPEALKLSDDMLGLAWGKLLINLNNAVNALSGRTLIDELKRRDYRRVFAAAMREGLTLLQRAEIEPATVGPISPNVLPRIIGAPDWLFNNVFLKQWKIDAKARSSMADDLAACRKTEIDYLNGELVRLAERLQRDAPVNRAIVELVRKAEAGAEPLTPIALRKAVLGR
jgi:2-dehydropantoate 2-reductase